MSTAFDRPCARWNRAPSGRDMRESVRFDTEKETPARNAARAMPSLPSASSSTALLDGGRRRGRVRREPSERSGEFFRTQRIPMA